MRWSNDDGVPRRRRGHLGDGVARRAPSTVDVAPPDSTSAHSPQGLAAGLVGAALGWALFGAALPAVMAGAGTATVPGTVRRSRAAARRERAREHWPRLLEQVRLDTVNLGKPLPTALLAAGTAAPEELAAGFRSADRTWRTTGDFDRTLAVPDL